MFSIVDTILNEYIFILFFQRNIMFIIIKNGGKQYKVSPGDIIKLERFDDTNTKNVVLDKVIACSHDNNSLIGTPFLENVKVNAEILENKKAKKVLVFKKRRRHNSRRLNGHRQNISVVQINDITVDGKTFSSEKKIKKSGTKKKPDAIKKIATETEKKLKTGEKNGS